MRKFDYSLCIVRGKMKRLACEGLVLNDNLA